MQLYNTLSHKKERFTPIHKGEVGMYACGPTVYFFAHIGNMRPYIVEDVLKRALLHGKYKVKHVVNLTDVGHLASDADTGEDKIRSESSREHKGMQEIVDFYSQKFLQDIQRLNVIMPEVMPKPSEHIPEILAAMAKLNKRGYLYRVRGDAGGMYYDTSKFRDYGVLTKMSFEQLQTAITSGFRVERPKGIRNPTDFAVWRFADPKFKEFVWDSEYGRGFPGWHIECSVMSMKYLGEHFDIHCGGVDHIPVHHTNEIAQSEAITGKKFVNYWVHVEFVNVDSRKMAKSLRNIYTLEDLIKKGFNSLSYRYLVLGVHYRRQLNFTFEKLKKAEESLNAIYTFLQKASEAARTKGGAGDSDFVKQVEAERENFFKAVENDLNMPVALSRMHSLINEASSRLTANRLSSAGAKQILDAFIDFDSVLGLDFANYTSRSKPTGAIDKLIEEREEARKRHDFKRADEIRTKLLDEYGIILEDTKGGVKWYSKGRKKGDE